MKLPDDATAGPPAAPDATIRHRHRPEARAPGSPAQPPPAARADPLPPPSRVAAPAPPGLPARILAAATREFALRGFAATTVDRIAARARLNKAMIYYHFGSKQGLYRAVLRDILHHHGRPPRPHRRANPRPRRETRPLRRHLRHRGRAHPALAPIMLREVAEGGRRLDEETYTLMLRVVRTMTGIVDEGRAAGQFADVDPILLYLTTVWPIMVYLATTPIRSAIARVARFDVHRLDPERFIAHLQQLNRRTPRARDPPIAADRSAVMTRTSPRAIDRRPHAPPRRRARGRGATAAACREKPPADRIRVSGYVEATEVPGRAGGRRPARSS